MKKKHYRITIISFETIGSHMFPPYTCRTYCEDVWRRNYTDKEVDVRVLSQSFVMGFESPRRADHGYAT